MSLFPKILLSLSLLATVALADTTPYDAAPIYYSTTQPSDPVTHLQTPLDPTSPLTLLHSLLDSLHIPLSSQTLVFSRTSLQRTSISPTNPRALYFNDDTYVGYVPGGRVIEISSTDPHLGTTFYTLDQHPDSAPHPTRQIDNCLQCHASNMTRELPGLIIRSVFPDKNADPILPAGTFLSSHESPISERWGGWYSTSPLPSPSMANTLYDDTDPSNPKPLPALIPTEQFDADRYLTPHSDPVALLVLAHQVEGHNRLSRALYASKQALHDEEAINNDLHVTLPAGTHSPSTLSRIHHACDPLIDYFLFANESPLPSPIKGDTSFATDFPSHGPRDTEHRSLRELDLQTRLFKYPCSYLIYSPSFDALPAPALDYIYQRLHTLLTTPNIDPKFPSLTPPTQQAIFQILRSTKPSLPSYWLTSP